MQDSPLPSVECPEHYVQSPHNSPEPYIHPQQLADTGIRSSSGSSSPERAPLTEIEELELLKQGALWQREQLRCCVQKAGLCHHLGGELFEASTDQRYWVERSHYFTREKRTIEHKLKAKEEIRDIQDPILIDPESPFSLESKKKWALENRAEFLTEAYNAGITLLHPSEVDDSSCDRKYWHDELCFYMNETQMVKHMARQIAVRATKKRAMHPPSPPRVLSPAEKETMARNKQGAKEHREQLHYWTKKAELEVLDLGDLDESSCDPEYWRRKFFFYYEEMLRVQWIYRAEHFVPTGHISVATNPETGERYVEDFEMYGQGDGDPQQLESLDLTQEYKKADRSHAAKPRIPHKAKPPKNKASDPASRGAVSKRSRVAFPISSRLRSKARPVPRARQVHS